MAKDGRNPTLIAELPGGYAVLGDTQFIRGYSLLLAREHTHELHDMAAAARMAYLRDVVLLGEAIWRAVTPAKMNYAILGNEVPHVHYHIHPRYADELARYPFGPISSYPKDVREDPQHGFSVERHGELILAIRRELDLLRFSPPAQVTATFCVRCGTALVPSPDPALLPSCPSCGWFQPTRALPVVLVLAHSPSGRVVYTRQRDWPAGAWGLVAGYIEAGETAETSAMRELEEETGLTGRSPRLVRTISFGDRLLVVMDVEIDDADPRAGQGQLRDDARGTSSRPHVVPSLMRGRRTDCSGAGSRPDFLPIAGAEPVKAPDKYLKPRVWYETPDGRWVWGSEPPETLQALVGVAPHGAIGPHRYELAILDAKDGSIRWDPGIDEVIALYRRPALVEIRSAQACEVCWITACPFCPVAHQTSCPRAKRQVDRARKHVGRRARAIDARSSPRPPGGRRGDQSRHSFTCAPVFPGRAPRRTRSSLTR